VIGERFGNFRIAAPLGRGGMGEVWVAEQQNIGTRVAIKLLAAEISRDHEQVQRFFNEARAVSRIQHAGIVKIFDCGFHTNGQAYLVMELLEGETLAARIARAGRLPLPEIADVGRQIASVLDATHAVGVTHRDLKPDNIYLVPDRELASRTRVKVLDFGIAKLSGTLAGNSPRTIGTMGTPAYMAPEQWGDASKVDWRADLYSLGCVVFEMATGRPPFQCTTIAEACAKHLSEPPPRAHTLADVPPALDDLLARLLAKQPAARPASMEEVALELEALAPVVRSTPGPQPAVRATPASQPVVAASASTVETLPPPVETLPPVVAEPPDEPPHRRSRRPLVIAGGALALGGVATAVFLATRGGTSDPPLACEASVSPPKLDGSSSEPVLLRYHFAPGETTRMTIVMANTTNVHGGGVEQAQKITMTMKAAVAWRAVAGDRFTGDLTFTNATIDTTGDVTTPGQPPRHVDVHWTSDHPEQGPETLAPFKAMLGVTIPIQVSPRGELLASDFRPVQEALHRAGAAAEMANAFSDDMLSSTFVQLPEQPVKLGDTWSAGEITKKVPPAGEANVKFQLKVLAISADKRQVLLETRPEMKLTLGGPVKLRSQQTGYHLWLMFDNDRGDATSAYVRMCMHLAMDADGQRVDADADTDTTMTSTREAAQTASVEKAPPEQPQTTSPAPVVNQPPATRPPGSGTGGGYDTARKSQHAATTMGTPQIQGDLDKEIVRRYIRRYLSRISYCYEKELLRDPNLSGTVTVQFFIAPSGSVIQSNGSGVDPGVASCVAGVIATIVFPKPTGGGGVKVTYPFTFHPTDDGGHADAQPKAPPAPKPKASATTAGGSTPDDVLQVVQTHSAAIQKCYETALKKDPTLTVGKVTIRFTISPSGRVTKSSVSSGSAPFGGGEACILAQVQTWRFAARAEEIETSVPFMFGAQ
jgi:serine/threonine protein kinase